MLIGWGEDADGEGAEDEGRVGWWGLGPEDLVRKHGWGALEQDTPSSEIGEKGGCGQWDEKLLGLTYNDWNFIDESYHKLGGTVNCLRVSREGAKWGKLRNIVNGWNLHETGPGQGKVDECWDLAEAADHELETFLLCTVLWFLFNISQ